MSEILKTDLLVVGSGPAGSTTARYAAEKGIDVTVLERRHEVGVPVRCGEFMPSQEEIHDMFPTVEDIPGLFDMPSDLVLRQMSGIDLVDPNGKKTVLDFSGYTTDRDRFDKHLMRLAEDEGARLMSDCMFNGINGNRAVTSEGEIEYKVLIGADGPGSRVARSIGLPANRNPYPAVTAQAKGDYGDHLTMFFGGIAPRAYGWIIPKVGQANVGVGFAPKSANGSLSEYFDKFAKEQGFEIMNKLEGKKVPSEGPIARTVEGNAMVVGDAAGHVISVNGGGIPLALIAGRYCGSVAADNIISGRPLSDYEDQWRAAMLKPLKTAAFNKKLADTFAFRSDATTAICMGILGARRMGRLIRCQRIFP
jgi:digeranylgeranylglycerophospholipid reductase